MRAAVQRLAGLAAVLLFGCGGTAVPIEIITVALPAGVRGVAYEAKLEATGGTPPLSWSLASGSLLPPGLRLQESGKLSGTPQAAGMFTLSLDVSDRRGARASGGYLIGVAEPGMEPARSSCATPIELDLSSGLRLVEGTYADAEDQHQLSCTSAQTPEHVFTFTLSEPADLELADSDLAGSHRTRRALRGTCAGGGELACGSSDVLVRRLPAGRWYLFIENDSHQDDASYSVFVRRLPATPAPANDACAAATPITFTDGVANLTGTLLGAVHDIAPTACFDDDDPDVWFSLGIDAPARISLSSDLNAEVFTGTCGAVAPRACLRSGECLDVEQPGNHLLRIFGNEKTFAGVVTREPLPAIAANDTCAAAAPLPLMSGAGSTTGRLARARDDVTLPCSSPLTGDTVHQLTLTERSDVTLNVSANGTRLAVALASGSCASNRVLACSSSHATATVRGWALEPGTYPLFVEGADSRSCWKGEYAIAATVKPSGPAPSNDTCAGAADVVFTNGLATIDGNLRGAANDDEATGCSFSGRASGPDVFFRITLAQSTRLRIIPTLAHPALVFHLEASCAGGGSICSSGGSNPAALATPLLAAGTYYLVVDGDSDFSADPSREFQLLVQQF